MEQLTPLDAAAAAEVERQVLGRAKLRPRRAWGVPGRAVLAVDPAAAERRREDAVRERSVRLYPQRDGMTGLYALLPAPEAIRAYQALTRHRERPDR
ncbi:MAG: hypothetical protein H0T85_09365 [Geodermatophilaceae bacterium]|nr:hypothetical protein [Geodermatophilaceae bacterium]